MSTTRARIIAPVLLLALGLVAFVLATGRHHGGPAGAAPSPSAGTVQARTFTASLPVGWTIPTKIAKDDAIGYHLSSTGKPINGLGIGPAGTIGITVSESGTKALSHGSLVGRPAGSYSASQLLPFLVGQPSQAVGVVRLQAPTPTTLAGQPAGEEAFAYGYEGRRILQVDVVAERERRIVMVELDTEPSLATPSVAALRSLLSSWRWR